jgi:prolyl oligopeptidase
MLARTTLARSSLPAAALSHVLLTGARSSAANEAVAIDYPETRRGDVVDDLIGEQIPDPYRWLENDARGDDPPAIQP